MRLRRRRPIPQQTAQPDAIVGLLSSLHKHYRLVKHGDDLLRSKPSPAHIHLLPIDKILPQEVERSQGVRSGPKYSIDRAARINGVQIRSLDRGKKQQARILVYGSAEVENQLGHSYLELINFNDGFMPEWLRLGGGKNDLPVTYASFVVDRQK